MRSLVRRHIEDAVMKEWPRRWPSGERSCRSCAAACKSSGRAGARPAPRQTRPDNRPAGDRQICRASAGRPAPAHHRESQSSVNGAKWGAVISLAILTLLAIAFVHSGNRRTAAIAMALFASAASVAIVMIAAQERPFAGHFAVTPKPLEQVEPMLLPQ